MAENAVDNSSGEGALANPTSKRTVAASGSSISQLAAARVIRTIPLVVRSNRLSASSERSV
jgi:hypothetical protein